MNSFNSLDEIFEEMKKRLTISDTAMTLWINPLRSLKLNSNQILLYIKSPFAREMITTNFKKMMEASYSEILGFNVEVSILCEDDFTEEQIKKYGLDKDKNSENKAEPDIQSEIQSELQKELEDDDIMKTRLSESEQNSNYTYTFDTFIVGDNHKLAFAACKAVVEDSNVKYNPLYIYSEPGLGKTHLLTAVKTAMEEKHKNFKTVFTTADTFTSDFVTAIRNNDKTEFKNKYHDCDMLLIDDVQFMAQKMETQQELFNIFNNLLNQNKQIIFTSDRPPKELNNMEQRLISRFEMGLLADINPPEYETRVAIIKRKAELYNLNLPDNVIEFLANKLKTNIRQLEGAVKKINALKLVTGATPTLSLAQNVVKDIQSNHEPIPVTVEKIINEVGKIYSVSGEDIRSQKRSSQISIARQVSIYAVSKITDLSYSLIGNEFGGRDHSTIVYAINKVKSTIEKDPSFKGMIEDLIKNLSNNV